MLHKAAVAVLLGTAIVITAAVAWAVRWLGDTIDKAVRW